MVIVHQCEFCDKTFDKRSVLNAHKGKEHREEVKSMVQEWADLRKRGMTTKEIAAKYNVHALTVSKHLKKVFPDSFHEFKRMLRL